MGWKRLSDLGWMVVAILIYLPFFVAISIAILVDDGKPVLFRQRRRGRGGRSIEVLKFRTMREGRVTRAGKFLRKSGLDELPQFLNILRGEMSFVGPRPLTEDDIARLGWSKRSFRWKLRPGITGLSQIHAGASARESLAWDRLYLRKMNPLLDTWILGVTFIMNFMGKAWVKRHVLRLER